jgi:hypothetical protein
MKNQETIYYPTALLRRVMKLAKMQRRSKSEMAIILIEEGVRVFQAEWKQSGTVPTKPKAPLLKEAWDDELRDQFGC